MVPDDAAKAFGEIPGTGGQRSSSKVTLSIAARFRVRVPMVGRHIWGEAISSPGIDYGNIDIGGFLDRMDRRHVKIEELVHLAAWEIWRIPRRHRPKHK